MKPRTRAKFVKKIYVRHSKDSEHLMSYPEGNVLVHFGSAPGTTYQVEEETDD